MVKKNTKRFLSVLLSLLIVSSCFVMNFSMEAVAAEENVASIGDVYYNSVEDALNAAVSGDTVIVQKDTTITKNVTVKSGVTLLVPHKDGYTGYNPSSGNPDVNSNATGYVTDVLYRTLTVNEGVTIEVNGTVMVTAILGLTKSGHYRHEVNGNYAQMVLNGKMNVNNGGIVVSNGYIKGSGAIEAFSGAEVRDLFVIEHFRGGTHSSYMRTQGVWIANEYDVRNITVEITIHYGAEFTVQNVAYFNSSFSYNVATFIGSSDGIFILKEGGKLVRTIEYRDRIGKEAEVYRIYGGGYLGSISIKIYISILPVTVNSSSFVLSMDGDNELHLYDGDYNTYYNSKAISMKFLPGCEVTIHDGAKFSVDRYKTTTRDRYSQIVAYRELTDSQFTVNYRYPQGRPSAKCFVENGGELYVDGEIGGEIYLDSGAVVTKGDNAVFSVTTKESAKLSTKDTETYVNDAEFIAPEGYHTRWEGNQLIIEEHTYSAEVTADKAPTCTEAGTGKYVCTLDGCGAYKATTIPATGHSYTSAVTAPDCENKGYTTHTCANCGDSYVDSYVDALGHSYGDWKVTDATCTADGSKTKTCSVCGDTVTEKIPATGHTAGKTETVDATCTENGKTTVYCSVCSGVISETVVPTTGHKYTSVVTAPDCENKGYTTYTCQVCGDSYAGDYVNAPGHTEETVTVDATCTEDGSVKTTCTVCGEVISEEVITANGHAEETVTVDATCTEDGLIKTTCTVCGEVISEEIITALGHTEKTETVDATCTENGLIKTTCTVCGEVISEEIITALGHTEETETVDATCTEDGLIKTTCTVCGEVISEETITAPGHDFGDWVVTKEPAINSAGEETRYCKNCDAYETQEIAGIDLKLNRIHMTTDGDNITFTSYVNAHNIAFYTTTKSGSDVLVTTDGTPIGKTRAGDRYVVYYKDWKNAGEKCETTLTVDGKTYNLSIVFEARELDSDDFVVYEKYTDARVDNENKIITLIAPVGSKELSFNQISKQYEEFVYTLSSDENVTYSKAAGETYGKYTISVNEATTLTKKIIVNDGRYCEKEYTLKVIFKDVQEIDYIRTIRSDLSIEIDENGEEYISVNLQSGKTAAGIYKELLGDEIESYTLTLENGVILDRADAYVAYVSQNTSDVYGVIEFTMADGTTKSYKIVFNLGLGEPSEEVPEIDIVNELKLIRGTASLSEDGKTVVITLASGKTATGVYTETKSGYTVKIETENGTFASRTDAYVAYVSQNSENVEGTMTVTLNDGTTAEYAVIYDLGK